MNKQEILEYIQKEKENLYFDRKSAKIEPKDIVRHVIGFANANGGMLAIGVENDGSLSGFSNNMAHSVEDYKMAIMRYCHPVPKIYFEQIKYSKKEKDFVLLIHIDVSTDTVIYGNNEKVYLRNRDNTFELTHSQIISLEYDKGTRFFEDQIVVDADINDIDQDILNEYKEIMSVAEENNKKILEARGLLRNDKLTNAAILLFGKNPTKFLPNARVKFIRYDGKRAGLGRNINIIKEVTFDQAIPIIINKIADVINSQLREFQTLNVFGKFEVIPEYPEFAWFEGIINALTHRDYSFKGDYIKIIMFDDRLEIFSPGRLPNIVTLDNMKETRFSRNPRIARFLSEFGWVKELNEGVNRIYSEMQRFFLNMPKYSEPNNNAVLLVLENSITSRRLRANDKLAELFSEDIWMTLNVEEQLILHYVYDNNRITTKEAAKILNRSLNPTRNLLKDMQKQGLLSWCGLSLKDPKQYYTLAKELS